MKIYLNTKAILAKSNI